MPYLATIQPSQARSYGVTNDKDPQLYLPMKDDYDIICSVIV